MIRPFSGEAEARIMRALDSLIADEHSDVDPNEAIAKAAADANVPANHLGLLVRGYNTARATYQRESGESAHEKAAEFPLASVSEVTQRLYPDEPDTPVHRERRAGVSAEYSMNPAVWYVSADAAVDREKISRTLAEMAAGDLEKLAKIQRPIDYDAKYREAQDALRMLEMARTPSMEAEARFNDALAKFAMSLNHIGGLTLADVRENAHTLHGPAGTTIVRETALQYPQLAKHAAVASYHRISDHRTVYGALAEVVRAGAEYLDRLGEYDDISCRVHAKVAAELECFNGCDDDRTKDEYQHDELIGDVAEPVDELLGTKTAAGPIDPMARPGLFSATMNMAKLPFAVAEQSRAKSDPTARANRMYEQLRDPVHEAKMQDIESQAAIQQMLLNDDVIASHDPREVSRFYRELSTTAPHFARQPMLTRPLLRRALTMGALDTFDADGVVGTEQKMRQNTDTARGIKPQPEGEPNAKKRP